MNKHKDLYFEQKLDGHKEICYSKDREVMKTSWQIALAKSMIKSCQNTSGQYSMHLRSLMRTRTGGYTWRS